MSCDADGVVKTWDTKMVREKCSIDAGPHAANCAVFDRSGEVIVVASDDTTVKVYTVADAEAAIEAGETCAPAGILRGHSAAVESVAFDPSGKTLVTAGSDCAVKLWSAN